MNQDRQEKHQQICRCAVLCLLSHSVVSDSLHPMNCSLPGSSVHGDSPGKNTGGGCLPSSRGSSQPKDRTQVSCIAGRFFTIWATGEALLEHNIVKTDTLCKKRKRKKYCRIVWCLQFLEVWLWYLGVDFFRFIFAQILEYTGLCLPNVGTFQPLFEYFF